MNMSEDEVRVSKPKVKNYCFASNLKRSLCEAILQPLTEADSSNSSNPSNVSSHWPLATRHFVSATCHSQLLFKERSELLKVVFLFRG